MTLEIRPADLAGVREVRAAILRPHERPEDLVYGGDEAVGALHLGAFQDGRLVAIASIAPEPPPGVEETAAWRIRGMATAPELRGRGIGGTLLESCVEHARGHDATLVWCNGRIAARAFYERHGFEVVRGPFEMPPIGSHVELHRRLR